MPNMDDRRYPVEPLLRLFGIDQDDEARWAKLGRATGIGANTTQVALTRGRGTLSATQADEWATGAGLGPEIVWPEWMDAGEVAGVCRCKGGPYRDPDDATVCDRCGRDPGERPFSRATQRDRRWLHELMTEPGLTRKALAEREGVGARVVYRNLNRVRIQTRQAPRLTAKGREAVVARLLAGEEPNAIAADLRRSPHTIRLIRRQAAQTMPELRGQLRYSWDRYEESQISA